MKGRILKIVLISWLILALCLLVIFIIIVVPSGGVTDVIYDLQWPEK